MLAVAQSIQSRQEQSVCHRNSVTRRLFSEDRRNFIAEYFNLSQHFLERNAPHVEDEELAVVVPEVAPKAKRLVDHLLRTSDRERGMTNYIVHGGS